MICEVGVGYGSRPLRKKNHRKVEVEKEAETKVKRGRRKEEGKEGSCFLLLWQNWLRQLFPDGLSVKGVEPMPAGGAHHYHSQGMCLLRSSADSTLFTSEGGTLPAHMDGPTWGMKKMHTPQEESLLSAVKKMGPRCCPRRSQEAARDIPEFPLLNTLCVSKALHRNGCI